MSNHPFQINAQATLQISNHQKNKDWFIFQKKTTTIQPGSHIYYPALTGIRAVAAYLVFVHHYNPIAVSDQPWLHHLLNEMHIGVSMFFVLSGFLIASLYKDAELNQKDIRSYFKKRFARIYPLWFLLTILTFGFGYLSESGNDYSLNTLMMNLTFLKGFSNDLKFTGIAQGWTLTVEETFYLAAPIIFLIGRRWGWWWQPLVIYGVTFMTFVIPFNAPLFPQTSFVLIYTFAGRCMEFYAGILLSVWVTKAPKPTKFPWYTIGGIAGITICMLAMAWVGLSVSVSLDKLSGVFINNIILPFAIAWLYLGLILEKSWISTLLSSAFFQQLGRSSYAFYLTHVGIFAGLIVAYSSARPMVVFVITLVLSWLLYRLIEEPCRKWLRGRS